MLKQEKINHKNALTPLCLHCALCICIMNGLHLTYAQEYLLNHKHPPPPSINKITPKKVAFFLELLKCHVTHHDDLYIWIV